MVIARTGSGTGPKVGFGISLARIAPPLPSQRQSASKDGGYHAVETRLDIEERIAVEGEKSTWREPTLVVRARRRGNPFNPLSTSKQSAGRSRRPGASPWRRARREKELDREASRMTSPGFCASSLREPVYLQADPVDVVRAAGRVQVEGDQDLVAVSSCGWRWSGPRMPSNGVRSAARQRLRPTSYSRQFSCRCARVLHVQQVPVVTGPGEGPDASVGVVRDDLRGVPVDPVGSDRRDPGV